MLNYSAAPVMDWPSVEKSSGLEERMDELIEEKKITLEVK